MMVKSVPTFDELVRPLSSLPIHERAILKHAYDFALEAHAGQKRASGEAYVIHCIEVARILIELELDTAVVAAGLLHDIVEDTPISLDDLQNEFGEEIAMLVSGVTKLDQITDATNASSDHQYANREAEFLRKTLLAMNDDIRVILVKLADRLHNMRTLGHLPHDRQIRMARETMEIFAPLASRLGIWQLKWELEDLAFRYLEPDRYRLIARLVDERRADRDFYVAQIVDTVTDILAQHGIQAEVSGRSKHIYSIWQKMENKRLPIEQIFDVRAIRVITTDIFMCYQALAVIHQTWRPIAGAFDDYIAAPKDNFYQSLHTAVLLPDGKTLEVQIRTPDMHTHAEYGVAAHWRYKGSSEQPDEAFEQRIKHLRELMEVGRNVDDAVEFLDAMRTDVFQDRVYAFTPRGDIVDLPIGSTPIDFAYHIHTDIGHRCRGAKVYGRLVPLHYTLQVGDRVEILTAKRGGPSRDWLNSGLGYVKTKRAAAKIRQWFRRLDRDKMILLGREVLERELKRLGVEKMSHDRVAELMGYDRTDEFLAQLGFSDITPQQVATRILEMERTSEQEDVLQTLARPLPETTRPRDEVRIQGAGGLMTSLARCCNPAQGDDIIGYITRGRGVTIHRTDCHNIHHLNPERLIAVEWGSAREETRYHVPVTIEAYDREGLTRDIATVIADARINMREVNISTKNHIAYCHVIMEVESAAQLADILSRIARLPNVMDVRRITH